MLVTSGRRYTFKRQPQYVDLGLRLADVTQERLASKTVAAGDKNGKIAERLRIDGATKAEIDFLFDGQRAN